jgi:hypothetical protein
VVDFDAFNAQFLPSFCAFEVAVLINKFSFAHQLAVLFHLDIVGKQPKFAVAKVVIAI